jgi:hypothetical protein
VSAADILLLVTVDSVISLGDGDFFDIACASLCTDRASALSVYECEITTTIEKWPDSAAQW